MCLISSPWYKWSMLAMFFYLNLLWLCSIRLMLALVQSCLPPSAWSSKRKSRESQRARGSASRTERPLVVTGNWASSRLMPTFNRQSSRLLEDLFQETINKTTKNMANIDYNHGDEMRHMQLLQRFPLFKTANQQVSLKWNIMATIISVWLICI